MRQPFWWQVNLYQTSLSGNSLGKPLATCQCIKLSILCSRHLQLGRCGHPTWCPWHVLMTGDTCLEGKWRQIFLPWFLGKKKKQSFFPASNKLLNNKQHQTTILSNAWDESGDHFWRLKQLVDFMKVSWRNNQRVRKGLLPPLPNDASEMTMMECNQGINSVWGLTDKLFQVQKELQIDGSCGQLRLAYEARWLSSLSSKEKHQHFLKQSWTWAILDCLLWPFCACENLVVTCGVVESVVWVFWNFATCLTSREKLCPQANQMDFNTKDDLRPPFDFENDAKTGIWDYLSVCFVRWVNPYCSASLFCSNYIQSQVIRCRGNSFQTIYI